MIDVEFFGYGAGLVLLAWVVGMCIGVVFNLLRTVRMI